MDWRIFRDLNIDTQLGYMEDRYSGALVLSCVVNLLPHLSHRTREEEDDDDDDDD